VRGQLVEAAAAWGAPGILISMGITAGGVTFAVWLVRRFAPEAAGSGIQEVEGDLAGLRPIRWRRVLPVKFVGGLAAIGTGMIAGREGPTVHMGAALGRGLCDLMRRSAIDRHVLVAAGAAAGLTAAFNTPFAGILFVVEEMRPHFRYGVISIPALIVACVASDVVVRALLGSAPTIALIAQPAPPLTSLWLFALLGCILGLLGPLFNRLVLRGLDGVERLPSPYLPGLVIGAAVGGLAWIDPIFVGGGYRLIADALAGKLAVGLLLLVFLARYAGTVLCYLAGSPGGIFAPLLAVGTVLGLWFGDTASALLPDLVPHPAVFTVAGMGALFAAVVHAPLTGVALALGLTANHELLLAVLTTCAVASLVAHLAGGRSIYTSLLERSLRDRRGDVVAP
jgi:CIC family chloride channel protein